MVVTDGGAGFAKVCHAQWLDTRIQRCLFHISANIRSRTTRNPRHKAGQELYALSQQLTRITNDEQQAAWISRYTTWCAQYKHMLAEKTVLTNGCIVNTHERLVRACNMLNTRLRAGDLFTYLNPEVTKQAIVPAFNNQIESCNARLRAMLRTHRDWLLLHRIKACMWWCYMHTQNPLLVSELIHIMPAD
ncbi:hypothetical protein HMPREF2909_02895 [Alloscardovia sp. HMSC034E08]|nr:hypothetical protein HMPREF2909_02895 [Alloscardovia sp. HMSC034E08]